MSKLDKFWAYILPKLASDADPDEVKSKVEEVIKDSATEAERDNESEADRLKREEEELKAREAREKKDRDAGRKAEDIEEEKEKMAKDSKLAMDAAIQGVEARFAALRQAERDVRPVVGELACDSAEEVYRTALKQLGCDDHASLPAAALSSVFKAYARPAAMAQDSSPINTTSRQTVKDFFEGK